MLTLADICAQLSADPGRDMDAHLLVLYSLVRFLPARNVIEIGVDDGSSTMPLLLGVGEQGGVLHSIDIAECPIAKARVEASGYAGQWYFHQMPSVQFADELQKTAHPPIDLVLIDGDHGYEAVMQDWRRFHPHVRRGGLLLFHDMLNVKEFPGIARVICEDVKPHPHFETFTIPYGWGLTLARKL